MAESIHTPHGHTRKEDDTMHDDELTPAEQEALRALPRERPPGDLLEERTVRALAGRGWIQSRRTPARYAWAAAVAACLLFFVAGFSIGKNRVERPGSEPLVDSPSDPGRDPSISESSGPPRRPSEVTLVRSDTNQAGPAGVSQTQYVVWF